VDWITDDIAIGNYVDAEDSLLLRQESVGAILGLTRTLLGRDAAELGLKAIEVVPLEDGPGNDVRLFRMAVNTLGRLLRETGRVLVHCHAGRSRSAVVVAAHLMLTRGLEAEDALALIGTKRPINITAGLERLLEQIV
jgi:protein-tyrosine phosphatase